jgi:hypothetical protein
VSSSDINDESFREKLIQNILDNNPSLKREDIDINISKSEPYEAENVDSTENNYKIILL